MLRTLDFPSRPNEVGEVRDEADAGGEHHVAAGAVAEAGRVGRDRNGEEFVVDHVQPTGAQVRCRHRRRRRLRRRRHAS